MGGRKPWDEGTGILSAYARVSGADWWLHFKAEFRSGEKNLKSNEERDQPTENFKKCAELEWPSILSQRLF